MVKYCPQCGYPNPDDASFCIKCGSPLFSQPNQPNSPPPPPATQPLYSRMLNVYFSNLWLIIIPIIELVVALVFFAIDRAIMFYLFPTFGFYSFSVIIIVSIVIGLVESAIFSALIYALDLQANSLFLNNSRIEAGQAINVTFSRLSTILPIILLYIVINALFSLVPFISFILSGLLTLLLIHAYTMQLLGRGQGFDTFTVALDNLGKAYNVDSTSTIVMVIVMIIPFVNWLLSPYVTLLSNALAAETR
ncbi:zinc ribbon domain-containing protein [Acidianus sp. RZ1]|uniref:zinc ribbon domain-containing protein n=1 Tax=Acidianus sp. RZ1 TaxID=1540082 RepID=UPI0014919617|nr:zinc ribbon domain-containing protein [Acidianus sp. RZ1]NON61769.1 zinc ribbon domain-containing protein [Acidianus sp. RZ1]